MGKQSQETIAYRAALKKYNALAKKADRRMRELERFSRYEEYKDIKKFAYKKAEEMIRTWTPLDKMYEGRAPRWQRSTPLDTRSLKAKIKDIERFLAMKSSTLKGVKEIYKKRAETLNLMTPNNAGRGGFGTSFTWQTLAHFFEDGGLADKTFEKYGSATVLLAFGKIQRNKKKALDLIKSFDDKHKITDSDAATQNVIDELLLNYGDKVKELLTEKR